MDSCVQKAGKPLKEAKNKKRNQGQKYPRIVPRHNPIQLMYSLGGVCASLKNSQQIVPGNSKLLTQLTRLNETVQRLEHQVSADPDQLKQLRQQCQEINNRIAAGEDRARKNWLIQCERYRRWLEKTLPEFRIWMDKMATRHKLSFPVGHIKLRIIFYFPTLHRRDGPNKEQAIFDMLKAVKFVPDDSWTIINGCNWEATLYPQRPRTDIYITIIDKHRSLWSDFLAQAPRKSQKGQKGLAGMVVSEKGDRLL